MVPYRPEPLSDFGDPRTADALRQAVADALRQNGQEYPLLIRGYPIWTTEKIVSVNPSEPDQIVGSVAKADALLAAKAVEAAWDAFPAWSRTPPAARADVLFKAAALLRRRKHTFSAYLMIEAGKTRVEADADTAEAIDFMEYYGRQMLELSQRGDRELVALPGERNRMDYLPLGVGIVIAPWNFPLAILMGMTTAALVAGNTVVVKPSSLTPVIAWHAVQLLLDAGLPQDAIQFVSGSGPAVGETLAHHRLTRFVSFTGSRDVGVKLAEWTARVESGQIWLKRFVGELGGKDAIVVDRDADLEAAADGIVGSAFGYSGQKCSACSRAIVHQDVYDDVLKLCADRASRLKVGSALDEASDLGPVIDSPSMRKILDYMAIGRQEGRIVCGGGVAPGTGYLLKPTIVADIAPAARLSQEEIFGPVLSFTRASDFDEAIRFANLTDYGLTGAVYTRSRENIEKARTRFAVGNLYINRKCTGATVGVHPFGGFNLSGTDSKAGGPDYLMLFTQPKVTSERL